MLLTLYLQKKQTLWTYEESNILCKKILMWNPPFRVQFSIVICFMERTSFSNLTNFCHKYTVNSIWDTWFIYFLREILRPLTTYRTVYICKRFKLEAPNSPDDMETLGDHVTVQNLSFLQWTLWTYFDYIVDLIGDQGVSSLGFFTVVGLMKWTSSGGGTSRNIWLIALRKPC